jgi:hypothetical protein
MICQGLSFIETPEQNWAILPLELTLSIFSLISVAGKNNYTEANMLALRLLSEGVSEGPNTELLMILMVLLGFFALSIIVGWAFGSRKQNQVEAKEEAVSVKKKAAEDQHKGSRKK